MLKAKRTLGQINAAFRNGDPKFRLGLYLTFVRPILEYASPAWSPYLEKDVLKLEKVQRRFTKSLVGLKALSYKKRLDFLNLDSLELRREKQDLTFAYKILTDLVDIHSSNFFTEVSTRTRGNSLKLYEKKSRLNLRQDTLASHSELLDYGTQCQKM